MKRFAFIAMLVVFSLVLVTCDEVMSVLQPEKSGEPEWTDVEYEIEGRIGNERVKSVKLYLQPEGMDRSVLPGPNTYGVRVSDKQRAIMRALSAPTAAASHDFFEAVFTSTNNIVRTTWEIGYPAGVSGSLLEKVTGYNALSGTVSSTVFVGRKTNKTLLGVGQLTAFEDTSNPAVALGEITNNTYSLTYTVAPLRTWVGMYSTTPTVDPHAGWVLRGKATFYGSEADGAAGTANPSVTFVTNPATAGGAAGYATTVVTDAKFTPIQGRPSVYYPLFTLRGANVTGTMNALYTIGGITNIPTEYAPQASVLNAIHVFGTSGGTGTQDTTTGLYSATGTGTAGPPNGGLQVIKRKPAYLYNGRTYQAGSIYDGVTTVGFSGNNTHNSAFNNVINITFVTTAQSSGIFAITFQCPVFALTTGFAKQNTTYDNTNKFVKWFIRPADGPDLYLLDSGYDEGGMVLIGNADDLSDDWIEIKTTGIGFENQ